MRAAMLLVALLMLVPAPSLTRADEKSQNNKGEPPAIQVDPVGQPLHHGKRRGPRLILWWADGVWHVRATTVEKAREFTGTIRVIGGKVTKVFNYQGMETRKGPRDAGLLNDARTSITFRFRTKGHEDGFDFTVSPKATDLQFDHLAIDGYGHPQTIVIGANAMNPPKATFTLPAHPAKPGSGAEEK